MGKRTLSRIKAMIVLYHDDLMKNSYEDVENEHLDSLFLDDTKDMEFDEDFYNELVNGVRANLAVIDRYIAICLYRYVIDRLSYLDRAIVRIAVYEMKFTDTPHKVIINEALNLSKDYTLINGFDTKSFNNALLDKISRRITSGE